MQPVLFSFLVITNKSNKTYLLFLRIGNGGAVINLRARKKALDIRRYNV